jgi:dihydrofolate reductase
MVTLYNVISLDGFIADENGNEDFIPDEVWNDFLELCNIHDTLIIGKDTYAAIQSFGKELVEPFENTDIRKVIVTRDESFIPKATYEKVHSIDDSLKMGSNFLLSSGPSLNTAFLKEKLIDRIILNRLPTPLSKGIPQFETNTHPLLIPLPEPTKETRDGRKFELYEVSYD